MTWLNVDGHHLEKTFTFSDFIQALEFLNKAGMICEQQNHHADFELSWGKLVIRTWSHDVDGIDGDGDGFVGFIHNCVIDNYLNHHGLFNLIILTTLISFFSQIGDLFISLLKRTIMAIYTLELSMIQTHLYDIQVSPERLNVVDLIPVKRIYPG